MYTRMVFCFLMVLNFACQHKEPAFDIYGEIKDLPDSTLVTLYAIDQQFNLDSAYSYEGKFHFQGKINSPINAWIRYGNEYANIVVENTEMEFKSPMQKMHLYSEIKGGPEQDLQNELKSLQLPYDLIVDATYDSLSGAFYKDEAHKNSMIQRFSHAQDNSHQIYIDFGLSHPNSFLGMDILYRNRQHINRDTLELTFARLEDKYLDSEHGRALNTYLNQDLIEEGKAVPPLQAQGLEGQAFQLDDLKGNYVLLTFWTSYCRFCIMQNQKYQENLIELQKRVKLVHFSIDKNEDYWEKASQRDEITWYNVSDLQGPKGQIKTQFEVQGTPATFLIGPDGKLLKNFGGYDPQLNLIAAIDETIAATKVQ